MYTYAVWLQFVSVSGSGNFCGAGEVSPSNLLFNHVGLVRFAVRAGSLAQGYNRCNQAIAVCGPMKSEQGCIIC